MIETLLEKPYRVIDILPEQVPAGSAGQFFAVERYCLERSRELRARFLEVLLKLNCYSDLRVSFAGEEEAVLNPAPEELAGWVLGEEGDLCVLLPGEEALITLNRGDIYMTVYNPGDRLLERIGKLAAAAGLFLRKPEGEA